ncbi:MAG: chemotaxis response regulator protein-glutamate methylesterase [Deltaproteobacteria bacterium]|jgi:two-component system, chemotaxis family, response regulator WspF|nr:chemotaxis response regulator protein-glutamate methylesterase [Deltaproteobacteria bacterium]
MRIAIVNDLSLAVEILRRIVLDSAVHKVAWVAQTGEEAIRKCEVDTPDLILMDLFMPDMDGVEATRRIMYASPCPILVVTATMEDHAGKVFEAMGHGALDAINTPMMGSGEGARKSRDALLKKITIIEKLSLNSQASPTKRQTRGTPSAKVSSLIVIGASTGGPKALADILSRMPADLAAGIVIAQHVDGEFSGGMARWLDEQSPLSIRLAEEGAYPSRGTALLAGKNDHLVLTPNLNLAYTREPVATPFRPSVDELFKSVAAHWPSMGIAVLLTGMGRDGAEGMKMLHRVGWHTIAQDEATSVVYGMPKAARDLGAASEILPVDRIAPAILRRLSAF